jgi:radical SAM family uncharacterized protein
MIHKKILRKVQKPGRYIGSELHSIKKKKKVKCRFCLAFPDLYEVGMSHVGLQILYSLINQIQHVSCERIFTPAIDFEKLLLLKKKPLVSLENRVPLRKFDIVGFSLQYELSFSNILTMLSLGRIPLLSTQRSQKDPLIIAGGPCSVNPEPLAAFIDVFIIGDGEEVIVDLIEAYCKKNQSRMDFYKAIAHLQGVYIPSLYAVTYKTDGTVNQFSPSYPFLPHIIQKAFVKDYENAHYPTNPVVPLIKPIHERACVEIMRGCPHSCKFCQARHYYYPVRLRSETRITDLAKKIISSTGHEELSLLSLSSGDYPTIQSLFETLLSEFTIKNISLSLPSLRVEKLIESLPYYISRFKKSGLTFAPEAGSERLRNFIGKNINIDFLEEAARAAYKNGYRHLKLYFMIGLPTETFEDLEAMVKLIYKISHVRREFSKKPGQLNVGIGTFIPKPHTPFERYPMNSFTEIREKQTYLSRQLNKSYIKYSFTPYQVSLLESAITRGNRNLANVIKDAWNNGARLDAWSEEFNFGAWEKAFSANGLLIDRLATSEFAEDSTLAWSHIKLR